MGYAPALWCAYYTVYMPNGMIGFNGYTEYLCPWTQRSCGWDPEFNTDEKEALGVPNTLDVPWLVHWEKIKLSSMSCALCKHLKDKLGEAPFNLPFPHDDRRQKMRKGWKGPWDIHAFGTWLAIHEYPKQFTDLE